MGTIRVNEDVKERLRDLKREDESFNDLLDRLSRREKDVEEMAGFLTAFDEDSVERMERAHDDLNDSLRSRVDDDRP